MNGHLLVDWMVGITIAAVVCMLAWDMATDDDAICAEAHAFVRSIEMCMKTESCHLDAGDLRSYERRLERIEQCPNPN